MQNNEKLSAIILAGGSSRRMRSDKRLLMLNGKSMIQLSIELAQSFSSEIIISANDMLPDFSHIKTVKDIYPGEGPLVGLTSGLYEITNNKVLLLSCDMPAISHNEINMLLQKYQKNRICVYKTNEQIQPMPGIYPISILKDCKQRIDNNEHSIIKMIESNNPVYLTVPKKNQKAFSNINYPEEFAKYSNGIRNQ